MRLQHYSIHTERSYLDWINRYVQFHQMTSRADVAVGSVPWKIPVILTKCPITCECGDCACFVRFGGLQTARFP